MPEKTKRSRISACILGLLLPTSSLLYVRREGLACFFMFICALLTFAFVYTPVFYYKPLLFLFFAFIACVWLLSFVFGIWTAHKGISHEQNAQDPGPWLASYLVLFVFIGLMLSKFPVNLHVAKDDFLNVQKNDILVTQQVDNARYLQIKDYVIYLDAKYRKTLGEIIALPGDVLRYENGVLYRNDAPFNIAVSLPMKKIIVPQEVMLIYCGENCPQHTKDANSSADTVNKAIDNANKDSTASSKSVPQAVILPLDRVQGKALYVLFSTNFNSIGQNLALPAISK